VLLPLVVAPFGLDYVSSKNVIAALIPAAVVLGCGFAANRLGWAALAALVAVSVAVVIGIATQTQYQRADWRGAAEALGPPRTSRVVIFNPAFSNTGPFSVYNGPARIWRPRAVVVGEVAIVALNQAGGFGPTSPEPPEGPAAPAPPGFKLAEDRLTDGYRLIRYTAPGPTRIEPLPLQLLAFQHIRQVAVIQEPRPDAAD
jgi:hypothetical protein